MSCLKTLLTRTWALLDTHAAGIAVAGAVAILWGYVMETKYQEEVRTEARRIAAAKCPPLPYRPAPVTPVYFH